MTPAAFIHPTAMVDSGAAIGSGTRIWHWTHVCAGAAIGADCNLGQNVFVADRVVIGNGCKLQNNVSVLPGGDPGRRRLLRAVPWCSPTSTTPVPEIRKMDQVRPTLVRQGATLGANSTIVCGLTIGRYAFVGAGSVVNRNVADHALVVGNPARRIGWVCRCGERLDGGLTCRACGVAYAATETGLTRS